MHPSLSLQEECVMQQAVPSESPRSSVVNKCTVRPESSIGSTSATYVPSRIADLNKWLGLRKPRPHHGGTGIGEVGRTF